MNTYDNSAQIVLINSKENLVSLVRQFILSLDLRSNSKQTYERGLKRFISWFIDMQIINPTREDILAYKDYLEGELLSPLTISGYMVIVRRFFEYLEGVKVYPNVARGVKGMKRSIGFRKDPLTLKQIQSLFHGLERETITGKRDFAIINLLVRTGLRTIEIIRSNMGDIRQESGEEVLWIQGKGRDTKDEFVLLTESTMKPILEYLKCRAAKSKKEKDPLFMSHSDRNYGGRLSTRSISRIVKNNLRLVGIDSHRLTAHSLRHTAITLALQAGASIQEAQALGRHANINTTMIYAHNINRIAHAPERKIDRILLESNDEDILGEDEV